MSETMGSSSSQSPRDSGSIQMHWSLRDANPDGLQSVMKAPRDENGWVKVSAWGRASRATAGQAVNRKLPVLAGISPESQSRWDTGVMELVAWGDLKNGGTSGGK